MKYHFKVHKEKSGFWAECLELDGCQSEGKTLSQLAQNLKDALNLYLSEPENSKVVFPMPNKQLGAKRSILEINADPSVAAATLIRQLRINRHLTQHSMKDALGINNLSSYQRLEDPQRCNPELKTLANIKNRFPEFCLEELL